MTDSIYEKNLAAFRKLNPPLAQAITIQTDGNSRTQETRSGQLTLIYRYQGQEFFLHSRFNPEAEAEKIIQKSNLQADHIIIFGIGLGFHVKQVLMRKGQYSRVLVIEPDLEIVKHSLKFLNWDTILPRQDFFFFFGKDLNLLTAVIEKFIDMVSFDTLEVIDFPPEKRFHGPFFSAAKELIDNEIRTLLYDFKTRLAEDAMVPSNVLKNLGGILYSRPMKSLKNRFYGKPGFIVSAGPSLDKNILQLKKIRNRGVIICVDTALKPLLKRGVQPHFTITADPSYKNYLHIQGTQERMEYFLIAETGIAAQVYEDFRERVFSVSVGRPIVRMVEQNIGKIGEVEAWGSVISLAFNAAIFMGLNPVVFLGQDFAYTHMRNHCRGTSWEDTWLEYTRDLDLMQRKEKNSIAGAAKISEITDLYGNKTITSDRLILYKNYLAKALTVFPDTEIFNATEGGIFKEIKLQPLSQVIRHYIFPAEEIDFQTVFNIRKLYNGRNKKKLLNYLRGTVKFFQRYGGSLAKILNKLKETDRLTVENTNGLIKECEELKNSLYTDVQKGEIVEMWSQGPIYEFLKKSQKIEKQENRDIEKTRKDILEIFREYFTRLHPIVENIIAVIDSSIDHLTAGRQGPHE